MANCILAVQMLSKSIISIISVFKINIKKKFHRMRIGIKLNTEFENMAKDFGYSYS